MKTTHDSKFAEWVSAKWVITVCPDFAFLNFKAPRKLSVFDQ